MGGAGVNGESAIMCVYVCASGAVSRIDRKFIDSRQPPDVVAVHCPMLYYRSARRCPQGEGTARKSIVIFIKGSPNIYTHTRFWTRARYNFVPM